MQFLVVVLVAAGVSGLSGCGSGGGGTVAPTAPAIVTAPSAMTVAEGQPLTLTVTATGGGLSYQWEQDAGGGWTPVAGETGESWTMGALSSADDGLSVRCVVTNSAGEATSAGAVLTVRRVRFVRPGGTGTGTSWDDALGEVASAMALTGADADEVWVAAGTFLPAGAGRAATFTLPAAVALYGGFLGGEQCREERDPALNETVLSGDLGTTGVQGDNAYHVLTATGGGYLDGFTVRDGYADGDYPANWGGGLYFQGATCTLVGCRVTANYGVTGGAGYLNSGAPVFRDCVVDGNQGLSTAGLWVFTSGATFTDCTFASNSTPGYAGAMTLFDSSSFVRCLFEGNVSGGGGGALFVTVGQPTLRDCVLRDNTATVAGGAIYAVEAAALTMTNCELTGNSTDGTGGAVHVNQRAGSPPTTFTMVSCTVAGNSALGTAGIGADYCSATLLNCLVWNNASPSATQVGVSLSSTWDVSYCCVQGGLEGTGNVSGDPCFVNEAGGDYRIGAGSSCIDAADGAVAPELDLDGLPRWNDPEVTGVDTSPYADIGAHEYQGF